MNKGVKCVQISLSLKDIKKKLNICKKENYSSQRLIENGVVDGKERKMR